MRGRIRAESDASASPTASSTASSTAVTTRGRSVNRETDQSDMKTADFTSLENSVRKCVRARSLRDDEKCRLVK